MEILIEIRVIFFSCFGLNSCNIFAISLSVSMHRVVTITDLNVYRQHLSSIYKNINHFSFCFVFLNFNSFIEQCSNGKSANGTRDLCEALSLLNLFTSNIIIHNKIINLQTYTSWLISLRMILHHI